MSGPACKVVINSGARAMSESVERILIDPNVHGGRLPEDVRMALIQRLADVDLAAYKGNRELMPEGGVAGILCVLQDHGLVTDEVWELYKKPGLSTLPLQPRRDRTAPE